MYMSKDPLKKQEKIYKENNGVISKIYYDPAGYGSKQETYQDAKQKYNSITKEDVNEWFAKYVEQKKTT